MWMCVWEREWERASQMSRQMNPQIAMKMCFYQNLTTLPAAANNVQSFNNFSKRASWKKKILTSHTVRFFNNWTLHPRNSCSNPLHPTLLGYLQNIQTIISQHGNSVNIKILTPHFWKFSRVEPAPWGFIRYFSPFHWVGLLQYNWNIISHDCKLEKIR
jgi:hypothetical protein